MSDKQNPRFQKIQSLIRRSDWKQAYKEARFLAKTSHLPELEQILISTLWNWIKSQVQRNQREEAKNNIRELLNFSTIPQEIQNEFPPVFRSLGLNSLLPKHFRLDISAPEIQNELVDLFLVKGEKSPELLPETLAEAKLVQDAFQKIEAQADDDALALLRPIAYHSPLAEWRIFMRGLVDYYRNNDAKSEESWKRLSSERPPYRIAEQLRKSLLQKQTASPQNLFHSFFNFFRNKTSSDPLSLKINLIETLKTLEQYAQQGKFKELVGRFQAFRNQFQKTEPALYERVLWIVRCLLISDAPPDVFRQFVECNLPLPFDPRGNLAYALFTMHYDKDYAPRWLKDTEDYIRKYADDDVNLIESSSPQIKARIKSIAYHHIAMNYLTDYTIPKSGKFTPLLEKSQELIEKAIAADPTYLHPYQMSIAIILLKNPKEKRGPYFSPIADVNKRILEHIPDCADAVEYLFGFYIHNNEPETAQTYFEKLEALNPLAVLTVIKKYNLLFTQIRKSLKEKDFTKAEQCLQKLQKNPIILHTFLYRFDVLTLVFAYVYDLLQNKNVSFNDYVRLTKKIGMEKPLPLMFAILVEGWKCGVPDKNLQSLEADWSKGISGRCNGNTAGMLGDLVAYTVSQEIQHPKIQKITNDACDFVSRAGQVKWNSERDLYCACQLLWMLAVQKQEAKYQKTFKELVRKGIKQHPNSLPFTFFLIEAEWMGNPRVLSYRRRQILDSYHKFMKNFASSQDVPEAALLIQIAEQRIKELEMPNKFAFDDYDYDDGYEDDYDDWDEDDEDDDDWNAEDKDNKRPSLFADMFTSFPSDWKLDIKKHGCITPMLKSMLEELIPKVLPPMLRKIFIECLEEVTLKNIPPRDIDDLVAKKIHSLSIPDQILLTRFIDANPTRSK
ncbi:MAG: hypothetical protein LBJ67_15620 [Planctomycetaceae bacterium]|jgi:hypothetical protein|nr:hypothetical protein [Planctomycetaceae bacterium]